MSSCAQERQLQRKEQRRQFDEEARRVVKLEQRCRGGGPALQHTGHAMMSAAKQGHSGEELLQGRARYSPDLVSTLVLPERAIHVLASVADKYKCCCPDISDIFDPEINEFSNH